jgi:hypothetical protein
MLREVRLCIEPGELDATASYARTIGQIAASTQNRVAPGFRGRCVFRGTGDGRANEAAGQMPFFLYT